MPGDLTLTRDEVSVLDSSIEYELLGFLEIFLLSISDFGNFPINWLIVADSFEDLLFDFFYAIFHLMQ